MSVLTKIFVVLVTLMSVTLVAAIVPFVANTEDWKDKHGVERTLRKTAEQTAQARQQQLDEERSAKAVERQEQARQVEKLETRIGELVDRQAELRAQLRQKDFDIEKLRASESQAQSALKIQIDTNNAQGTELASRRDDMRKQAVQLVELEQRRNELEIDNENLTQQLRFFKEELTARGSEIEKLEELLKKIPDDVLAGLTKPRVQEMMVVDPPHDIEGRVIQVRTVGEDVFVQVDVGRVDGASSGMRFYVQRGDQYVGTLIVTEIAERDAAGRMKLVKHEVAVGDRVTAGPGS